MTTRHGGVTPDGRPAPLRRFGRDLSAADRGRGAEQLSMINSMTRVKIAITIPEALLADVKAAVAHGEASSVSAYISEAVARRHAKRPLELYVDMLKAEHGEPSPEAYL